MAYISFDELSELKEMNERLLAEKKELAEKNAFLEKYVEDLRKMLHFLTPDPEGKEEGD